MFESIYYHWRAVDTHDGALLNISEIEEARVEVLDEEHTSRCVIINGKILFVNTECLFKTEKDAVKASIKCMKTLSLYYYERKIEYPKNMSLFLFKVNAFKQKLFKKYNIIYPELFI